MNIYTDLVGLLLDRGGEKSFNYTLLPYLIFLLSLVFISLY